MTIPTNKNNKIKTKIDVIIIKDDRLDDDPHVSKISSTLNELGFKISLLEWNNQKKSSNKLNPNYKYFTLSCSRPIGNTIIFYLPFWGLFVFIKLLLEKWDVAHVVNIHSILPVLVAAKIKGNPVIYEIEDAYQDSQEIPQLLRGFVKQFDRLFLKSSDAIILIDEKQKEEFPFVEPNKITVIYDSPSDAYNSYSNDVYENDQFIIFNDGMLYKTRNLMLENIFEAVNRVENVKLIISGQGDLSELIKRWCDRNPQKFQFLGYIEYSEVIQKSFQANLLLGIRSDKYLTNKYNCGSKVLKAMMCGKPCLVHNNTSAADKVRKENCGIIVNANNVDEIEKAIVNLKNNPELREKLGDNGRIAYKERYSWDLMKKRLSILYDTLLE